jgi:hypothetical protein
MLLLLLLLMLLELHRHLASYSTWRLPFLWLCLEMIYGFDTSALL